MQNASKLDSEGAPVLALQNIPGATLAYIYIELFKKGPMGSYFSGFARENPRLSCQSSSSA